MYEHHPSRRAFGPRLRAATAAATLVLLSLPAATGQIHAAGTVPHSKLVPAPKVHTTHAVVPLVAVSGAVVVTDCTTAGYAHYSPGATPPDVGLGGALANGNVITFACNATLSGAGPYTIVVPQATSPLVQVNTANFSGGTLSIDGSDGGKFDVTIDGGSTGGTGVQLFFVDSTGTFALSNITLTHGHATIGNTTDGEASGGAIQSNGALTLTNDTFASNAADNNGGAVESTAGSAQITGSTFVGNRARNFSGAVDSGIISAGTYVIANSTFVGNSAPRGGVTGAPLAAMAFTNVTMDSNTGTDILVAFGVTPSVANSILANDTSGAACDVAVTDGGGNVEYPSNTCGFSVANGDSFGNPNLGPLANNGGPTQTEALLAGSAAINLGLATTCILPPVNDLDQRGVFRDAVLRGHCDSGAWDSAGGLLTLYGAFPITGNPPARLGFMASENTTFPGGYITLQVGGLTVTARFPISITRNETCTAFPCVATVTLSGIVSSANQPGIVGDTLTVTITVTATDVGGVFTRTMTSVRAVVTTPGGTVVASATYNAPFPFGTVLDTLFSAK